MFEERQIQGERNGVNVGRFKVKNVFMNIVLTSMRYKSKGHFDENVSWTCCILRWIPDKWDRIYLSRVLKNKITNHLFGVWDQKAF
jgi:hypothetical protein